MCWADCLLRTSSGKRSRMSAAADDKTRPVRRARALEGALRRSRSASAGSSSQPPLRRERASRPCSARSPRRSPSAADSVVVDVGAGLAGASAWLASLTGAQRRRGGAGGGLRGVPQRRCSRSSRSSTGVQTSSRSTTPPRTPSTAIGVCSLLDDLDPLLDEAVRVLRPGGRIGIADLFLVEGDVRHAEPNTLRSVAYLSSVLARRGFVVVIGGVRAARAGWVLGDAAASDRRGDRADATEVTTCTRSGSPTRHISVGSSTTAS